MPTGGGAAAAGWPDWSRMRISNCSMQGGILGGSWGVCPIVVGCRYIWHGVDWDLCFCLCLRLRLCLCLCLRGPRVPTENKREMFNIHIGILESKSMR